MRAYQLPTLEQLHFSHVALAWKTVNMTQKKSKTVPSLNPNLFFSKETASKSCEKNEFYISYHHFLTFLVRISTSSVNPHEQSEWIPYQGFRTFELNKYFTLKLSGFMIMFSLHETISINKNNVDTY